MKTKIPHVTGTEVQHIQTVSDLQTFNETTRNKRPWSPTAQKLLKQREKQISDEDERLMFILLL